MEIGRGQEEMKREKEEAKAASKYRHEVFVWK